MDAVRQIGFFRLRQRDFQNLLRDRRFVLENRASCLRGLSLLFLDAARGSRDAVSEPEGSRDCQRSANRSGDALHWTPPAPALALGMVTMTERFSFVRYFCATRSTSA